MVSVIIPCYNGEKYLRPCLESVINQTHQDWEVVLIDDGSTDQSLAIAQEMKAAMAEPDRLRIFHQDNHGLPFSRNRAMRHARGQAIFFLDCDDWLEAQALEVLVAAMDRQADIDVAWMGFSSHYQKTGRVRTYRYPYLLKDRVIDGKAFFLQYLRNKYMIAMGNALYDKSFLDQWGLAFDESKKRGEDIDFEMRTFLKCRKVASTAYSGFHYRLHGDSMVHQDRKKIRTEFLDQQADLLSRIDEIEKGHSKRAALLYEIVFANVFFAAMELKGQYRRATLIPAVFYWLRHPILHRQTMKWNIILWMRSFQDKK